MISKKKAVTDGIKEAGIELVKRIPVLAELIEGFRGYQESIQEQQRKEFTEKILIRLDQLEANQEWYKSQEGQEFIKKVVATSLNAEYADKIDFLVNALTNGPSLHANQALRLKFVEMIRQASKPAMEVLVAAAKNKNGTGQIIPGDIAGVLGWDPAFVDACVSELHALGAFSSVIHWQKSSTGYRPSEEFSGGEPALTEFTKSFVAFISEHK